jgi:DNA-binding transcriptional MerR regulator
MRARRPVKIEIPPVPGLTLPAAAYASRVDPVALRHWLDRRQVALLVPQRSRGAWRRLQPADIVRVAVIGYLVRFGFTVAEAREVVEKHVDRRLFGVVAVCGDIPWPLLRGRLFGLVLEISRQRDGTVVVSETTGRAGAICLTRLRF